MKATIHGDVLEEQGQLLATGSTLVLRKVTPPPEFWSASVFVLERHRDSAAPQSGLGYLIFGKLGIQGSFEADDMHVSICSFHACGLYDDMHVSIYSFSRTEVVTVENANVAGDGVQLGRCNGACICSLSRATMWSAVSLQIALDAATEGV